MEDLVFLLPTLPLLGFVVLMLFGKRLGEPAAGWIATAMVGGSFAVSVALFFGLAALPPEERAYEVTLFEWIQSGELSVSFGFLVDPLSLTMALFITGVGALIHMYAIGYMHGDPHFSKFFVYLNLFVFAMLILVLGDNLLLTFLGWEGVGACSYFLISFWFTDEANATAGKKAFITNRVGDFGLMLAMFLLFFTFGSLNYSDIFISLMGDNAIAQSTATAIVALLFLGAVGKSAQLPLYLWLPDAMAGPTPVSALIHAATMVTSGVYLLTRMNPVIAESADWVQVMIVWVGLLTALFAASIAIAQNDIKKVLAYSTVSQLGFMFVAVGAGLYVAAVFHMITHAFFKALLFLGAGSVIHGMDDEQDMRRYGGLAKVMPITAGTFIVGWLAIGGVPPFSGFWSKDDVLLAAYNENTVVWVLLLIAAMMTAFYMSRAVFLTFFGKARWDDAGEAATPAPELDEVEVPDETLESDRDGAHDSHGAHHPHESPWVMWVPLVVLASFALFSGVLNLPFDTDFKYLEHWLEPVLFGNETHVDTGAGGKWALAMVAIVAGGIGLLAAFFVYLRNRGDRRRIELPILARGWRYDEAVTNFMGGPGRRIFDVITWFDRRVIDGAVDGTARATTAIATRLRPLQTGLIRSYALFIVGGTLAVLIYFLARTSF
ncbi:MAG: NADH-quinone oxidoreductase subunit L [Acidimicrobiales bacterium]